MASLPSIAFLGRIYRISAPAYSRIYIGSTRGTIAARLGVHPCLMRRWEAGLTNFTSSFEVLAQEGATVDLIEESTTPVICIYEKRTGSSSSSVV